MGLLLLYNNYIFDHPFKTGYASLESAFFASVHQKGFMGITTPRWEAFFGSFFSIHRGLFTINPVFLLSLPGFYYLLKDRKSRAVGLVCLGTFLGYIYFISSFSYWVGGDTFGPRHLTPLIPFLMIPLAAFFRKISEAGLAFWQRLATALIIFGILAINFGTIPFPYYSPGQLNPLRDMALEFWRLGYVPYNMGNLLGLRGIASAIPYFIIMAGVILFISMAWPGRFSRMERVVNFAWPLLVAIFGLALLMTAQPKSQNRANYWDGRRYMRHFEPQPRGSSYIKGKPLVPNSTMDRANESAFQGAHGRALYHYQRLGRGPR